MVGHPVIGIDLDSKVIAELFGPDSPLYPDALARLLDDSGVDFVVFGGDTVDSESSAPTRFDASIAATIVAALSHRVGLVVAADPRLHHPYNLARRLASLDHASRGRVGWLVGSPTATAEFDGGALPADAVLVARKLWESFPAESVVADADRGVFVESEQITFIDHDGVFAVSGPLNVPEPPQRKPPVLWRARSEPEFAAATNVADVVIAPAHLARVDGAAPVLDAVDWQGSWPPRDQSLNRLAGTVVRIREAGEVERVLETAAKQPRPPRPSFLRDRLGVPPARRAFDGPRRSLFPVS